MREEVQRKLIHILGGFGPPVAVLFFGWTGSVAVLGFLLVYCFGAAILSGKGISLPMISSIIRETRREGERYPLAPLEFLLVILAIGLLFPEPYFFPAIAVLAFGDGVAALAGILWGRRKLPWNPRKSWMGLAFGCALAIPAAVLFSEWGEFSKRENLFQEPILGAPIISVPLFLGLGFLCVWGIGVVLVRRAGYEAAKAISWGWSSIVLLLAFAAAALPIVLAEIGLIEGRPILAAIELFDGPLPLAALVLGAVLTMVFESVLPLHDNLLLPPIFLLSAWSIDAALAAL